MVADVEGRARAAGPLIQLTINAARTGSHRFYEGLSVEASHVGFKRYLDWSGLTKLSGCAAQV